MRRDVDGDGTPEDYYYHGDAQNNIHFLTDASGNIVEAYAYGTVTDPWVHPDGGDGIHLLGPLAGTVIRVSPPMTMTETEARESLALLHGIIETRLAESHAPAGSSS